LTDPFNESYGPVMTKEQGETQNSGQRGINTVAVPHRSQRKGGSSQQERGKALQRSNSLGRAINWQCDVQRVLAQLLWLGKVVIDFNEVSRVMGKKVKTGPKLGNNLRFHVVKVR